MNHRASRGSGQRRWLVAVLAAVACLLGAASVMAALKLRFQTEQRMIPSVR
jgi:hypothetical protein